MTELEQQRAWIGIYGTGATGALILFLGSGEIAVAVGILLLAFAVVAGMLMEGRYGG